MRLFEILCLFSFPCVALASGSELFISAFNIQVFGRSKMSKKDVVEKLVDIILRYDLTIVQEIRDAKEVAFPQLVKILNATTEDSYCYFTSSREGRRSSKEQYGFVYKSDKIEKIDAFEFPDDQIYGDVFERSPYIVTLRNTQPGAQQSIFNVIVSHAKPRDAVKEVSALADVYDYATIQTSIPDAVIVGDLNADCRYIRAKEWSQVKLRTQDRFLWMIPDSADTTVKSTDCAYDRIVTVGNMTSNTKHAEVFNFQTHYNLTNEEAKRISDHFPVEFYVY